MLAGDRKLFHENIKLRNLEEVKKFVSEYPQIKNAFDTNNQTALTVAIKSKSFEVYSFLRSKEFFEGNYSKIKQLWSMLSNDDKEDIRRFNLKYFISPDNLYINDLMNRSRLCFNNDPCNREKIKRLYESLDEIEKVRPILMTAACAKFCDIIFDFNLDSVSEMDPTKSEKTYGTTYYESGIIYIASGCQKRTPSEVEGTLAHELTHLALSLTYQNKCMPFRADNDPREKEFRLIAKSYKAKYCKLLLTEFIVARAFNYNKLEPSDVELAELAVRVPQLYAQYRDAPAKIQDLREKIPEIFDFYENHTIKDMENSYPVIKAQNKIQELNKFLKVFDEISNSKVY